MSTDSTPEETPSNPSPVVRRRRRRVSAAPGGPEASAPASTEADAPAGEAVEADAAEAPVADAAPQEDATPQLVETTDTPEAPSLDDAPEPSETAAPRPERLTPDQAAAKVAAEMTADMAELMASGSGMKDIKAGDRVRGTVVGIVDESVLLDVGAKSEGFIARRELLGPDGELSVAVGDTVQAQVVAVDHEGVRLSVGAVRAHELSEQLESAAANRLPVRGKVVGYNKGGLEVKLGGRRAFCPASQVDRDFSEDLSTHVGNSYDFVITRFDPTGRRIVVSRRALLEAEAKELASQTRQLLEVGAVLAGTVRKLTEFGAFVDLGGIDGLVHVSEISWDRIEKPSDALSEGEAVQVKVLKIDQGRNRIALSIRQAGGDPWAQVGEEYLAGGSYTGKVSRLTDFGAFIELAPGLEGLVHVSEIDWKRIRKPSDVLTEGQEVTVKLMEVDRKRKRLALSIKEATEDPWLGGAGDLSPGSKLEVTVEKIEDFGVFCTISDGVTGLMPSSMTNTARGTNLKRLFRVGQKIEVFVHEVDRRRRKVTLTRNQESEGGQADFKEYKKRQKQQEEGGLSALALALQDALEK